VLVPGRGLLHNDGGYLGACGAGVAGRVAGAAGAWEVVDEVAASTGGGCR